MTNYEWPFWWFVPQTSGLFDIRVFNMVGDTMTYIENALVEIIQSGVTVKSGYTDSNGKYTTVLGAGTYTICISKTGYKTITKTETLQYATELMVNLPMEVSPTGKSGLLLPFVIAEAANPQIILLNEVTVTPNIKTCSITLLHQEIIS